MIKTLNENDMLKFKDLSAEEKAQRGILGTLFGPIASVVKSTRNGRKYSDEVWERVFSNPITKEMLAAGGIPGELDHPIDRDETDSSRIAIMMPEAPKKDSDGHLVARFDIIDTPMGKIASALAKYGFKFGISSRGTGDTYTDNDGNESVDPDTYDFQAFDLVLLPACEDARLRLAESYYRNQPSLKKALTEALESANEGDRKLMEDALTKLDIDYSAEQEEIPAEADNIKEDSTEDTANDIGVEAMKDLQEALKKIVQLEGQVRGLQEKLSVCYTKEGRYEGTLKRTKIELARATATNEQLAKTNTALQESLSGKDAIIADKEKRIKSLTEKLATDNATTKSLNENLTSKSGEVKRLTEKMESLQTVYNRDIEELTAKNRKLNESLLEQQKDAKIQCGQLSANVKKATQLAERYKTIARTAVDKYIESRAERLGLKAEDIKRSLKEGYSFADIDKACEDLQRYNLKVNALPFSVSPKSQKTPVRMTIKESVETIKPVNNGYQVDDDIDESLLSILN